MCNVCIVCLSLIPLFMLTHFPLSFSLSLCLQCHFLFEFEICHRLLNRALKLTEMNNKTKIAKPKMKIIRWHRQIYSGFKYKSYLCWYMYAHCAAIKYIWKATHCFFGSQKDCYYSYYCAMQTNEYLCVCVFEMYFSSSWNFTRWK